MPEAYEHRAILLGSGDIYEGGGGSTIDTLLRLSAVGLLPVRFAAVICNNSETKVPGFYRKIHTYNDEFDDSVEVITINGARYPAATDEEVGQGVQTLAEAQACADVMDDVDADFFVQAGLMKKTVGALLRKNGLNTHPGPLDNSTDLPDTVPAPLPGVDTKGLHGIHVQEAVLDRDYPYSAHTTHVVAEEYDSGRIIGWRPVLVRPDDTAASLFSRVQQVEKACLPGDIYTFAEQLRHGQAA